MPRPDPRRHAGRGRLLIALVAIAAALALVAPFGGRAARADDPPLPARSRIQFALRNVYDEYVRRTDAGRDPESIDSAALGAAADAVRLTAGRVLVDAVAAANSERLLAALEKIGLGNGVAFGRLVSGQLPVPSIGLLAGVPGLHSIRAAQPVLAAGSVLSQGDAAQRSNIARATHGVDGSGVTVGVLSDSFNCTGGASGDISTGDLPVQTTVLAEIADCGDGADEGRAMAQLIHDVAPGARIVFRTAFDGQADFAQGIIDLADAGADVIVDDVVYPSEPMFQDGVIAQAVDRVVSRGIAYFSSAGNSARDGYESGFTAGTVFADGAFPSASGAPHFFGGIAHDFDPGAGVDVFQSIKVSAGTKLVLTFQWDQPSFSVSGGAGSASEIDVYLLNSASGQVVAGDVVPNLGGDPVEAFSFQNPGPDTSFNLMIVHDSGPLPGFMKYIVVRGRPADEFATDSGTVFGHTNAAGAEAVGAAAYFETPAFGATPPALESFSSAGNTPILFDITGAAISETRQKPEIVAPDGGNTTFFGGDISQDADADPNFFGTSAAAPHAAGAAALMLERSPTLPPSLVYNALESTAIDMGVAGFDFDTGFGLIDTDAAISAAPRPPDPPSDVNASAGDGQATVSWQPPADDGGLPITFYSVGASPSGGTATTSLTSALVTGLTNDVTYTFTVTATNAAGTSASSTPSNAVTPPGGTTVSGVISLQGVASTSAIALIAPTVSIAPHGAGASTTVSVSPGGSFAAQDIPAGTYTVTASAAGFVSRQRQNVVVGASPVALPGVELRAGLVDSNSAVNIHDITAVIASFGATPGDRLDGSGRVVDINADGVVDVTDVSLAVSNFGATSPQGW